MKALIAEDDNSVRLGLKRMLSAWNFEIAEFADGQTAWQYLQTEDVPDMMLLDRVLPGMDGVELCRHVRADQKFRNVYIIFLTVRNQSQDVVEGLQAGADDYITKPFNSEELKARVQTGVRALDAQEKRLEYERMKVLLEMAGATSHEISQPLTVILGRAERLLERLKSDDPCWAEAEAIIRSAERIQNLVASMSNIQSYATKPYTSGVRIFDFKQANQPPDSDVSEA